MILRTALGSGVVVCKILRFPVQRRVDDLQFAMISNRVKKPSDSDLLVIANPGGFCGRFKNGFGGVEPPEFDQHFGDRNLIVDPFEPHGVQIRERCFLLARSIRQL